MAQVDIQSAPQAGTYTLIVATGDAARAGTGTYKLTLAKAPGFLIVPADDEGGATNNGENHTGGIYLGDLDQWVFTATTFALT